VAATGEGQSKPQNPENEHVLPRGTYTLKKIPGSVNFFKPSLATLPCPPVGIKYHKILFPRKIYSEKGNILIF